MQKYGLKVESPYATQEEKIIRGNGDIVITEPGRYRIFCNDDTYVHHNIVNSLIYIVCESEASDIEIKIKATGKMGSGEVADVYHQIISNNKNVSSHIESRGVAENGGRIIYRSSLAAKQNSTGEGKQSAKFIILDNTSEVDAEPSLDIESDTFPTTHAVSIGGVNEEKVFYAKLHGFSEEEAKSELVAGFLNC